MKRYIGLKIAGCIVLGAAFIIGLGFGTMYLWNWLIPALFAGPVITFWQAWGLILLSKILFGFPKGGGHHEGGWGWRKRKWKERMKAKMEHMSPEEKERIKNQFERCMGGRWGSKAPKEDLSGETKEQL